MSVAVRLHPVILEAPGLSGEHVGEVAERHPRGHVAGRRQELGAFAVRLCVPGNVSVGWNGSAVMSEVYGHTRWSC